MKFNFNFIKGRILGRAGRFTAEVLLDGNAVQAHIPTSGRLAELIRHGNNCYMRHVDKIARKTTYDLLLIEYKGCLVYINAVEVNAVLAEAIRENRIDEFKGYEVQREYTWGNSRFDLLLTHPRRKPVLIEAKSVTLCEDGVAMFPDAPTTRGIKHLKELQRASKEGYRTFSIFIAPRADPEIFKPNWATDPDFSNTLKDVSRSGVNVRAYRCDVSLGGISLADRLPIKLSRWGD